MDDEAMGMSASAGGVGAHPPMRRNLVMTRQPLRLSLWMAAVGLVMAAMACSAVTAPEFGCSSKDDCMSEMLPCQTEPTCRSDRSCGYAVRAGLCFIDGDCFAPGELAPDNPCVMCAAELIQDSFVAVLCSDGSVCDAGKA